jgi:outer membrane protein
MEAFFVVVFICIGFSSSGQGLPRLTLSDAIRLGTDQNLNLKALKGSYNIAAINNNKGTAGYYPTLDFIANHSHTLNNTNLEFFDGNNINRSGAYSNNTNASLAFAWNLYDGKRKNAIKDRLQIEVDLADWEFRSEKENLSLRITLAYILLIQQEQLIDLLREQLLLSKKRMDLSEFLEKRGAGTGSSILQSRVDYHNDSIAILQAMADQEIFKLRLFSEMQISETFDFAPDTTGTKLVLALDEQKLLESLAAQNPQIRIAKLNYLSSISQINETQSLRYPSLFLNSALNYNLSNNQANFVIQSTNIGPSVGLTLLYNIYDGGNIRRQIASAKIQSEITDFQVKEQELLVKLKLKELLRQYYNMLELQQVQEEAIKINEENLQIAQRSYELGQITDITFREAQLNAFRAKFQLIQYKVESDRAVAEILHLSGNLINR